MQKVRRLWLYLIILLLLLVAYFSYNLWQFCSRPLLPKSHATLTIRLAKGDSVKTLAKKLQQQRDLRSPHLFLILSFLKGDNRRLKSGEYKITPHMSANQLLNNMVAGKVVIYKLVFVEGWTFKQMRALLLANKVLTHPLAKLGSAQLMQSLGSKRHSPEGLFFPSTYYYKWGDSDLTVLKKSYVRMQAILKKQWALRAKNLPYKNPYAALIVASMIEKETAVAKERPMIAGVIVRRLRKRIRLHIDQTVVYGLHKPYGYLLTREDLRTPSVYNTYLNYGLPPTPICMPSRASIIAAMHPGHSNYLYYVAKPDGTHVFSVTYKAHLAAVNRYQLDE